VKVDAVFSEGMTRVLNGHAIGDEFTITAKARIIGAEEVLVDASEMGAEDPLLLQGELKVTLLLSHPKRDEA
jgi:hypothetical protein